MTFRSLRMRPVPYALKYAIITGGCNVLATGRIQAPYACAMNYDVAVPQKQQNALMNGPVSRIVTVQVLQ